MPTLSRVEALARSGLFLLVLAAPLLGTVGSPTATRSTTEQRALAAAPALPRSAAGWRALSAALSAWFDDHFGLREPLIRLNRGLVQALGMGTPASIPVMEGADGWLYFTGDGSTDDFRGRRRLSDRELAAWAAELTRRQRWLAERGIAYLFVIVPNKQSVYPEFLPDWLQAQRGESRADQLVRHLAAHTGAPVLDLRPALLLEKGAAPLYRKTDSHWNARGADVALHHIRTALALTAHLTLPAWEALAWESDVGAGGDLARMLGRAGAIETLPVRRSAAPRCRMNVLGTARADITRGAALVDECPAGALPALVFRDSFMNRLRPMLSPAFRRTVYLWQQPDGCEFEQAVLRHRPQVVIEQRVERFLDPPRMASCP
jgi:hypothetical protein